MFDLHVQEINWPIVLLLALWLALLGLLILPSHVGGALCP
jgi:hypothetical protein